MTAFAAAFRNEIQRVARKELRAHVDAVRKSTLQHRHEIAALKRKVQALEKMNKTLGKAISRSASAAAASPSGGSLRFSADGLRKLRTRLTLSAAELGQLVGVSAQTVYNWERKLGAPARDKLQLIADVRKMGKRQVQAALQAR